MSDPFPLTLLEDVALAPFGDGQPHRAADVVFTAGRELLIADDVGHRVIIVTLTGVTRLSWG
ncbi:MAG: hypothetical protein HY719_00830, partial [Planctomycetes bacterium]|nr:hypothetical protein [Planctomycetota bacterium]